MSVSRPTRRSLLQVTLAATGGLAVGFHMPDAASQNRQKRGRKAEARRPVRHEINAWILVDSDDVVTVRVARAELGQGTLTGMAQLAAEELDCDWRNVRAELVSPTESELRGRAWGDFATSNSRSVRAGHLAMRQAGATARHVLLQAASKTWDIPLADLTAASGRIGHEPSRRSATYGEFAAIAASLPPPPPGAVALKPREKWKLIGRPLPALGTRNKIDGSAKYGIDVRLPGMLSAAIRSAPVPGGKLGAFDPSPARAMAGVRHVIAVGDNAVAVVADTWWQAHRALEAVPIDWAGAAGDGISSESIAAYLRGGLEATDAFVDRTHGDALEALRDAARSLDAIYAAPFLHHATLEPMNATALWQPDKLEVWAPTQNGEATHRMAVETSGLKPEQCIIHRTLAGGSFGRRLRQDYVRQAVLLAQAVPGVPIKLIWSREEDTTHGYYRPITKARLRAGLDEKGEPTGLILRLSGQSILTTNAARISAAPTGRDPRMFQGWLAQPGESQMGYSIPNLYTDHAIRNTLLPVGSWRGVHTTQNGVYLECFIDEMAHAGGRDPLEFRRAMMRGHPAHSAVLTSAATKADWATPPPAGVGRGLAQMMAVGSYAAAVAEVSVEPGNRLRLLRVVIALDCGNIVNPRLVEAQLEGAVAMAASATLYEEITIKAGRVVERNFDTYRILRLAEMPKVETVFVPSGDFWGGVGDAAIGCIAPAILNAIFAVTGKRIRSLPLKDQPLR